MAVTCNTVGEVVRVLDEQFGYDKTKSELGFLQAYREYVKTVRDIMIKYNIESLPIISKEDWKLRWWPRHPYNYAAANGHPVPPGWTREMVEDMIYFQDESDKILQLTNGPVEDQPKEGSMDDRRSMAGDIVEYEGQRHTVFCSCNSAWKGRTHGQHTFDWDDMCPDCGYCYWYEDTDDVTPPVQESSGLESLADRRPKAGDVVEYAGAARTAHCKCDYTPIEIVALKLGTQRDYFNSGDYDCECTWCGMNFWFRYDESVRSALGVMVPAEDTPAPTESLADVLPDLYGRKEHAAYMERMASLEEQRPRAQQAIVASKLGALMDGLCGKRRGMED